MDEWLALQPSGLAHQVVVSSEEPTAMRLVFPLPSERITEAMVIAKLAVPRVV